MVCSGQILSCASSTVLNVPAARKAKIADPRLTTLLLGTSTGLPKHVGINLIEHVVLLRNASGIDHALDRNTMLRPCDPG